MSERASWYRKLLQTDKGVIKPCVHNVAVALEHSLQWRDVLEYDEFHMQVMIVNPPPWKHGAVGWEPVEWTDSDDVRAARWMQCQGIMASPKMVAEAVDVVAKHRTRHPIREYLNSLKWDGKERVNRFAVDYLGSEDTPYTRGVMQCLLISAVARVMEPGCKADYMVVLEGPQGAFKSSAVEAMFSPWYSDDMPDLGTKDAAMAAGAAWCIEDAELGAKMRSELEKTKAFITRRIDNFRPVYGRRYIKVPRQSILIGTTNQDTYLRDDTGGRRFWPIACTTIDIEAIKADRDQVWAEAVEMYKAGIPWWPSKSLLEDAREEQDARYASDPWEPIIANWIAKKEDVSVQEILAGPLAIDLERRDHKAQVRVSSCLKRLGWGRYRSSTGNREWRYAPGLGVTRTTKYGKV